ncbi:hypothetical protein BXZ70DRAFT_238792 [Cristinia sonorae]|uniref:DUF6534 domain-containing protein n=1 Tax=Cristinia sonorae TaxID=1940300 RepID=A0A8K0UNY2_9AGAR|nr:hypothetical protein BXZ70DRAFT_238792 [Cristinia sonorae]
MAPAPPITDSELVSGYLIVAYLALILYGIVIAQAYEYGMHSAGDTRLMKYAVLAVAVLETVHTMFIMHASFLFSVTDFEHLPALLLIPWSAGASVACGMFITIIVQSFYIRRIYVLSERNWWITGLVSLLLFARTPFNFATAALMYTLKTWAAFRVNHIGPLITVTFGLGLSTAVDVLIAGILVFYLYRARTGFKNSDTLVHTLMAYTVNSGLLTMCCSTLALILFFVKPDSLAFAGLVQLSSKLYANSFLGTLNARRRLRTQIAETRNTSSGSKIPSSAVVGGSSAMIAADRRTTPPTLKQIQIFQETYQVSSYDHMGMGKDSDEFNVAEEQVEMVKVQHVL